MTSALAIAAFAALLAVEPMSSPMPQPTPLKTIGHVRTTLLCTALKNNLFPAVTGLRTNDEVIDRGRLLLGKMASDSETGSSQKSRATSGRRLISTSQPNHALQIDNLQLGELVHAIAQNLDEIEKLLGDPQRFPPKPSADDVQLLDQAKVRLEAVADQQRVALNILSGTYETGALQMLLAKGDNTQGALGPASHSDVDVNLQTDPLTVTSQQTTGASNAGTSSPPPSTPVSSTAQTSLFANNSWGQLATGAFIQQKITAQVEDGVLPTVILIVNACR
jgi:hypothetical protein